MTEELLQKLIKIIEDPQYVVMWNSGNDDYIILKHKIHNNDDELKVYFNQFRGGWLDLNNCSLSDLKIFKELEIEDLK